MRASEPHTLATVARLGNARSEGVGREEQQGGIRCLPIDHADVIERLQVASEEEEHQL